MQRFDKMGGRGGGATNDSFFIREREGTNIFCSKCKRLSSC